MKACSLFTNSHIIYVGDKGNVNEATRVIKIKYITPNRTTINIVQLMSNLVTTQITLFHSLR